MRLGMFFLIVLVAILLVSGIPKVQAAYTLSNDVALTSWSVTDGTIELSTDRYKADGHSLVWTWQGGSKLSFVDGDALWGISGITGWIYNERPLDDTLMFKVGPALELERDNPAYAFEFNLNFSGWRWLGVGFSEDARVPDYSGSRRIERLEIHAPKTGDGRLYFDLIGFPRQLPWWLPADRQIPFVNSGEVGLDKAGQLLYYDLLPPREQSIPSDYAAKMHELDLVDRRYKDWVLGDSVDWSDGLVKTRYQAFIAEVISARKVLDNYTIIRDNRAVLGRPLLPDENGRLSPFEDLFKCLSTLSTAYQMQGPRSFGNPFYQDRKLLETIIELFQYLNDQGWAAGSSFGANNRFIRTAMGGYANAVLLMKEELKTVGLWEQQLETLRWYSGFGEVYRTDEFSGAVTGDIRSNSFNRLLYVLSLENGPERVQKMECLVRWISQALDIAKRWDSFIKPDYTGYTHSGAIGNTYTTSGLHAASAMLYILNGTSFEPTQGENIWRALLQARVYSNKYDIPSAIACRWPFMVNSLYELLPAFAYGALTDSPLAAELARAYKRLWDPEDPQIAKLIKQAGVDFSYLNTIGAVGIMVEAADLDVLAEPTPTGNWHMPYAALSIHRRDDWMVSVKGWSQYVWNFECQPITMGAQNIYGRYMSHGAIQVYGTGVPVNARASGYVEQGWDWNRWPGTTAINLPYDQLLETQSSYGRHFTKESFVGGVTLEDNGIWAMRLLDPVYEPGFTALKTVFFFDDKLICLGSGISNSNDTYSTETTIYQVAIGDNEATHVDPSGADSYLSNGEPLWLLDPVGNGYYIPDTTGLKVVRQQQTTPLNTRSGYGNGSFEVAWIDHGIVPENKGYEFVIIPQANQRDYVAYPDYRVLRKDSRAHIVSEQSHGLTGYVLFEPVADLDGVIERVDTPCIALLREEGDRLEVALADPDLGWETRKDSSWTVEVTLRGQWSVVEQNEHSVVVVESDRTSTTMSISVTGGFTQRFVLQAR